MISSAIRVKSLFPQRIVVAVPVAPPEIVRELEQEVDDFIVLLPPREFAGAVGLHYRIFGRVEDETVIRLLHKAVTTDITIVLE